MSTDVAKKPARSTLEQLPDRTSRFLRGVATNAHIRAALASEGYDDDDHQAGWNAFHLVCGYAPNKPVVLDVSAGAAMAELDRIDAGLIDKIDGSLEHRFPAQRETILGGLTAGEKAVAVSNVKTILERLDALQTSSSEADGKALAMLAKRKLDEAERKRLAALVVAASSFEATSAAPIDADETRWAALEPAYLDLWAWHDEWTRAARRAISRRDWLLTLGLAKRRQAKDDSTGDNADSGDTSDA